MAEGGNKRSPTEEECDKINQAIEAGNVSTIQELLDDGVDVINATLLGDHRTPLHYAAERGNNDIVKILLEEGADVNIKDKDHMTPLYVAVRCGKHDIVKTLLEEGADVNIKDKDHRTLLHVAAEWGNDDIVKTLLEEGADVNIKDKDHRTPLHVAAQWGNDDIVKTLLEEGADVNIKDKDQRTPLLLALQSAEENDHDNGKVVKVLLEKGAEVNVKDRYDNTPLHLAAMNMAENSEVTVEMLLEKGAEVTVKNKGHRTPLHYAADHGNTDMVKTLLEEGADVNIKDEDQMTPLLLALQSAVEIGYDNGEVVKMLLEKGAEVNVTDKDQMTPLLLALQSAVNIVYDNGEVVKMLLEKGAEVNVKDKDQMTPLLLALQSAWVDDYDNGEVVKMLLEKGAGVNVKNNDHSTPLHYAVRWGKHDIVKALLEEGADVNIKDKDQRTPLLLALQSAVKEEHYDNSEVVKMMLEKGAEVNVKDRDGDTPLHLAAKNMAENSEVTVEMLLEKGADVIVKNNDQMTPLLLALQSAVEYEHYDNGEVVKMLLEKGAEVNVKDGYGNTPLHWAAMNMAENSEVTVKMLLEKGAEVTVKNNDQRTPLLLALESAVEIGYDNGEVVKMLLEKGAEVNVKDRDGNTPLHWAAMNTAENSEVTVKMLLEKGAEVTVKNNDQMTPLLLALQFAVQNDYDNGEVVKMLLEKGAEVNVKDRDPGMLLCGAARCGNTDIMKMLLEEGVDVNVQDWRGRTPLHRAVGHTDTVKMLLEEGADINIKDNGGSTPLHRAVGHTDTVKMLLEEGADVNIKDDDHNTPLHRAGLYGNVDVVKMLLQKGSDYNIKNKDNKTPLEFAVHWNQREVVKYLVEDKHIDTSQFNEETRERIGNLLKQTNSEPDDSRSHDPRLHHDDPGSHDPLSNTNTEQQVDQLTVEDVNKGYMDGELLGPDVRVALLGAEGSGKTCLCHTLVGKDFQDTLPTEGADHMEIVVESTTNWKPLSHEEKLRELDKQKCLESMSSAVKKVKSRPVPPVSKAVSASLLLPGSSASSFSSTVVRSPTPAVYSTQTLPILSQQSISAVSSSSPISQLSSFDSASPGPLVQYASSLSANLSESLHPGFDPSIFFSLPISSSAPQQALPKPVKRLKLSSSNDPLSGNEDSPFVSVRTIENLKAFRESYDPKKKYVNIWDFAGQQVFQHTHGIFISEEVVCLIVFDAGLALDELPERRYPNDRTPRRTVLETICYWMEFISSRVSKPSTSDSDLSILLPTFILVGTHTDKVFPEIYIARDVCFGKFVPIFKKELVGKPFSGHIAGSKNNQLFEDGSPSLYFICNKQWSRDSVVVNALKQTVMQAASITRKMRPTRYVEIERKLMLLSSQDQVGIIRFGELGQVAKSCGLSTDKEKLLKMTQYFHHKGALLHFHDVPSLSNIVILSPHWLAKLLTYVLTSLTCPPIHPVLARYAEKRQNEGLLEEVLIHWSVEQFNKSENDSNQIIANLRGIPIIELFTKFQLIVDVTQSSIAGHTPRGEGEKLFLVPHLLPFEAVLPSKDFSFKFLYNFPAHFIPDNLVDQLIVKCAQWNNDRHYDLIRLSYQWVCLELGKFQTYEVRPNYELHSIELTIIPDPLMPPECEEESYKESNELIEAVKKFIDDLMKEHMAATFEKFPVECLIPCPHCNHLHIKLKRFGNTGNAFCPTQNAYCDSSELSRYHKLLSTKGDPIQSTGTSVNTYSSPSSPDIQKPKMRPLLKFVIPRIAFMWRTVADFLDYEINTIELIAEKYRGDPEKCCDGLFRDWLSTNNGVTPKTWTTLMKRIKEIGQLDMAISEIEKDLDKFFNRPSFVQPECFIYT